MTMENLAAVMASFGPSPPLMLNLPWSGQVSWSRALLLESGAVGELRDAEDDELGGLHGRDADVDGEDAGVTVLGRVVLLVALDEERLRRSAPEQRAVAPDPAKEHRDRALDRVPQLRVVRLEDHPVRPVEDGLLDVVEQPPHVDVAPLRVARQRARAPDPDALAGERADRVDGDGVQCVVLALGDVQLERDGAA